jgi:endonuclease/exonuclease/phosphatase family metal-dependent hydrolase
MRSAALLLLAACTGVDSTDGSWEPIDTITGELAPEVGRPPEPRAPTSTVRIASFNIWLYSDPVAIAGELLTSDLAQADVIMLQEVEHHDGELGRAQVIADALGMSWVFAPARRDDGRTHGIAILSRYPMTNARVMRLPYAEMRFHDVPRNALAVEIEFGPRVVTLVNLHLATRIGPVDRVRQMHPAVTQVPADVAIGGDLNTLPYAWVDTTVPLTSTEAVVGQDQASVIDDYMAAQAFVAPIGAHERTYNAFPVDMRLDQVYVRGYTVLGHGIASDVDGSDHWPVWVDLAL